MATMNRLTTTSLLAGLLGMLAIARAENPAQIHDGLLTGPNQMTLYTFEKDVPGAGKSTCNGPCAENWPPFATPVGAAPSGDFSVVTRDDGSTQWAYKGKPLYYWAKDKVPGDKTGDGVKGVWHVATP